jgi:hypothetical protein
MWNEQSEKSYRSDLQGITEIWGVEQDAIRLMDDWDRLRILAQNISSRGQGGAQLIKIWEYLNKSKPKDKKVMGVRFCFLVKGKRRVEDYNDPNSLKITDTPLVRGYKYISPGGIAYAHSWYFPNPSNKSGKGALGKGWEKFNVWETEIPIKQWIDILNQNILQPECGDLLSGVVITPAEYFRDPEDLKETMLEVKATESNIFESLDANNPDMLVTTFPRNRNHCYWHYGDECEYIPVCWQPEVAGDIMGSGLYQIRTPHHRAEKEELERRKKVNV